MEFKFITTLDPEYAAERELRIEVLRKPLGLPPDSIFFPFEDESVHLVALDKDRVVGCVLFKPDGADGRLFQMAVDECYQRRGLGREL